MYPIPDISSADVMITYKDTKNKTELVYFDTELFQFAVALQNMLDKHAPKKGDSWKTIDITVLLHRWQEEIEELETALDDATSNDAIANEAADVALFAMFIWYFYATIPSRNNHGQSN